MRTSTVAPAPRPRRRVAPLAAFLAVLVTAFAGGMQLTGAGSASNAAVKDSCSTADTNPNNTVMTLTEHVYNCHPSTGVRLPTGGVIGSVSGNPAITAHWWNTVTVDGDTGNQCQPSSKWLRGSGLNWFSASCTQAP
jgi:hypothetical protein